MPCGGVLRYSNEKSLIGYVANLGVDNRAEVKIRGVYYGLQLAWNEGYKRIIISSDSQITLHLLQIKPNLSHPLAPLIASCKNLMKRNWILKLEHTFREGNRLADELTN